jgi:hypothetical protein
MTSSAASSNGSATWNGKSLEGAPLWGLLDIAPLTPARLAVLGAFSHERIECEFSWQNRKLTNDLPYTAGLRVGLGVPSA